MREREAHILALVALYQVWGSNFGLPCSKWKIALHSLAYWLLQCRVLKFSLLELIIAGYCRCPSSFKIKGFCEESCCKLKLTAVPSTCNSILSPPRCCGCVLQVLFLLFCCCSHGLVALALCCAPTKSDCHESESSSCFSHFSLPVFALVYTWEPILCKHKGQQPGSVEQSHLSKGCFSVHGIP